MVGWVGCEVLSRIGEGCDFCDELEEESVRGGLDRRLMLRGVVVLLGDELERESARDGLE